MLEVICVVIERERKTREAAMYYMTFFQEAGIEGGIQLQTSNETVVLLKNPLVLLLTQFIPRRASLV